MCVRSSVVIMLAKLYKKRREVVKKYPECVVRKWVTYNKNIFYEAIEKSSR